MEISACCKFRITFWHLTMLDQNGRVQLVFQAYQYYYTATGAKSYHNIQYFDLLLEGWIVQNVESWYTYNFGRVLYIVLKDFSIIFFFCYLSMCESLFFFFSPSSYLCFCLSLCLSLSPSLPIYLSVCPSLVTRLLEWDIFS